MHARRLRRTMAAVAGLCLTASLSACGLAPWQREAISTPSPTASASPSPSPIESITNELAGGTTQRQLGAGAVALTVNYWSTLNMADWTAEANKPVSFSMSGTLASDQGQRVYLSRVTVVPAVIGPTGALPAPPAASDQASVNPGYLVKAPYSYSQTFIMPAVDPTATALQLSFTYELLLQTTPTSSEYAKQTATDTLTIAIAGR